MKSPSNSHDHNLAELLMAVEAQSNMKVAFLTQNNGPFPSSLVPLFQSESKCETILLHENETACRTHFHKNGFELRLVLKQRHKRSSKWPIAKK